MSFIRKQKRAGRVYYQEVESRWIDGRSKQVHIRYIGTKPDAPPRKFEIEPLHAGALATGLMTKTLTANDVFKVLDAQGVIYHREELARIGIIYEFASKKLSVCLYPAGKRVGRRSASSASRRSSRTRRGGGRSSSSAPRPTSG